MMKNRRVKIIFGVIVLLALVYVAFEFIQFNRAKAMLAEGITAVTVKPAPCTATF
jgi:hypothetical protein